MNEALVETLPPLLEVELRDLLEPDEQVLLKIKGAFKQALICTDRRAIILKGGMMSGQFFGTNCFQIAYPNIAGVEVKFGLLTGYFEISAGGMQNTPKSFWKSDDANASRAPNCVALTGQAQADKFRDACTFIIAQKASPETSPSTAPNATSLEQSALASGSPKTILDTIFKLGAMRDSGILSSDEFEAKKKELLTRL